MDIHTKRLRLRQLRSDDAQWVAQEIANPVVHRWLTSPPRPYDVPNAETFIAANIDDKFYRVILSQDEPCGVISIARGPVGLADLGYWLAERHWGQGFMSEAARAMVAYWFADTNADLGSGWITGNQASRNVLEKLGFEADHKKVVRSEFHDRDVTVEKVRLSLPRWQALSVTP